MSDEIAALRERAEAAEAQLADLKAAIERYGDLGTLRSIVDANKRMEAAEAQLAAEKKSSNIADGMWRGAEEECEKLEVQLAAALAEIERLKCLKC